MGDQVEMSVAFSPASARGVRAVLAADLARHGVRPVVVADALVVASELVTNAVRYGAPDEHGRLHVGWHLLDDVPHDPALRIAVRDSGTAGEPVALPLRPWTLGGRGLAIVEALARTWWTRQDVGTEVAAVVALAPELHDVPAVGAVPVASSCAAGA